MDKKYLVKITIFLRDHPMQKNTRDLNFRVNRNFETTKTTEKMINRFQQGRSEAKLKFH